MTPADLRKLADYPPRLWEGNIANPYIKRTTDALRQAADRIEHLEAEVQLLNEIGDQFDPEFSISYRDIVLGSKQE